MIPALKVLAFAALALVSASAMGEERWQVEGAFPLFPGERSGAVAADAAGVAEGAGLATDAAPKAATPRSGCHLTVELTSQHAVGEPCLTTAAFMQQLGLSAAAKARVERAPKTAH